MTLFTIFANLKKFRFRMYKFLLFLACGLFFIACSSDYSGDIEDYLSEKNLSAQKTDDGLYYIIETPGNEIKPNYNSDVKVKYKGYLTDGTVFDENTTGIVFNLSEVIPGWTRGIPLFGEGGKGKLIIPPYLGYGDLEQTKIPSNSILIFEIELIDVL